MPLAPVTPERIQIAKDFGLQHVDEAALAARESGLPFWAACAVLEKESRGANVWGGADQSPYIELNDREIAIDKGSFWAFYIGVLAGLVPTGVGPCQITYSGALKTRPDGTVYRDGGYFRVMLEMDLKPWDPKDNMYFGFSELWSHYLDHQSWVTAGRLYNGRLSYGQDLLLKCAEWKNRLGVKGEPLQ